METLPFEIGETAHALRKAFDRRAVGLGVTRAQWKVLFRLTGTPGLRQVELADMLDLEPITLCRIVDRLEEAGLVERSRDPGRPARVAAARHRKGAAARREASRASATTSSPTAFAGIDPKDIEITRQVLGTHSRKRRPHRSMNRASNQ